MCTGTVKRIPDSTSQERFRIIKQMPVSEQRYQTKGGEKRSKKPLTSSLYYVTLSLDTSLGLIAITFTRSPSIVLVLREIIDLSASCVILH